jgi:hypothetical protein
MIKKKSTKKYIWYVNTGIWHKQLKIKAEDMEIAKILAFKKLQQMPYKKFREYVDLDVMGMTMYPSSAEIQRG